MSHRPIRAHAPVRSVGTHPYGCVVPDASRRPVTLTVVGAGLGRTGTHSLKLALERLLGGRCHHMMEVFGDEDERAVWTQACLGEAVDFGALLSAYHAWTHSGLLLLA